MMRRGYPRAEELFRAVREARHGPEVDAVLAREGIAVAKREAA